MLKQENMGQKLMLLGILAAFLLSLYFAAGGVDYGPQWDQNLIKGHVNRYVRTGVWLPGEYIYPPVSTYIAASTLLPYAAPFVLRYGTNWTPTQDYLLNDVLKNPNENFLLNLRRVFVFSTVLVVVWAGLAAAQRSWLAGLVAAGLLALSWEIVYHSRFIHPDGPTMQFSALVLLFGFLAIYKKRPFAFQVWLVLAAIAAGFATATKYTAGLSLVTVLIFALGTYASEGYGKKRIAFSLAGLIAIFGLTFVILVPGTLLETAVFIQHVRYGQSVYASGHGLQTVNAGLDYFVRIIEYLTQAAFSNNRILAFIVPVLAGLGIWGLLAKRDKRDAYIVAALAGVPLVYLLFLASNRVLFVRNLLQVLPSLAILGGIGFVWLMERLKDKRRVWRAVPIGLLVVLAAFNLYWLVFTTSTIQNRNSDDLAARARAAIEQQVGTTTYVTPAALQLLGGALPANASAEYTGSEDYVLFAYLGDAREEEEGHWPVNHPGLSPRVFGSMEINFDWHAHWPGVERLVLATPRLAWQDGAPLVDGAPPDPAQLVLSLSGVLTQDGEQFFVMSGSERTNILNSANPKVVLAVRELVDSQVTITGKPHSGARQGDWFLLGVNGQDVLSEDEAQLEYRSVRFLANLLEAQKACIAAEMGTAMYEALADNMIPLIEYSDEDLQKVIACTQ